MNPSIHPPQASITKSISKCINPYSNLSMPNFPNGKWPPFTSCPCLFQRLQKHVPPLRLQRSCGMHLFLRQRALATTPSLYSLAARLNAGAFRCAKTCKKEPKITNLKIGQVIIQVIT